MSAVFFTPALRLLRSLPRRIARRTLLLASPLLHLLLPAVRRGLLALARRSPWLQARLRRFRLLDYRLRVLLGMAVAAPAGAPPADTPPTLTGRRAPGHNQALKSPLENWLNP